MANLVNSILFDDIKTELKKMGSCLVVSFDKLSVADAEMIRHKFRQNGLKLRVVKNSLALKAFAEMRLDLSASFQGKCGIVFATEERAIAAAKLLRDSMAKRKEVPILVTGAVIEGQSITGKQADSIADMPDKNTVRAQILGCLQGPARALAICLNGLSSGLARCVQARVDQAPAES